jgi:glycosyltransferase involved in cell wall biosynthesis
MKIDLSIVIPVYNEEDNVVVLYDEVKSALASLNMKREIIFVDDGSTDETFNKLNGIRLQDGDIYIIKFRKNFGKSAALNAAFERVKGEIVVTMDGDLQDDPKEIARFVDKLNEGYDLVSGWKYKRNDPITKRFPSKIFNRLTSMLTGVELHDFNCGFKAYKKKVLENIHLYGEMHRYIPALAAWHGFKIAEIKVEHRQRKHGKSKYGFTRLIKGFLDLITVKFLTSYSSRPLHVFGIPGMLSLSLGFLIGFYLVVLKYLEDIVLGDRPMLLLSVLLIILGLQFVSMGLLGEMITFGGMKDEKADKFIELVVGDR